MIISLLMWEILVILKNNILKNEINMLIIVLKMIEVLGIKYYGK